MSCACILWQKGRQWALQNVLRRNRSSRSSAHLTVTFLAALSATALTLSSQQQQQQRDKEEDLRQCHDTIACRLLQSSNSVLIPLQTTQCDGWLSYISRGGRSKQSINNNSNNDDGASSSVGKLRRQTSMSNLHLNAEKGDLEARFDVDWKQPIGEGTFGLVYKARDRKTGDWVALKEIAQTAENDETFQREVDTLLYLRQSGGHSNICQLRANYEKNEYSYLVLDYIEGGEMFDHLATHGPYSEADAARLIREVASALAFLHGLNVVHADLKPENLMLSSEKTSAAVVKLVDFGSAIISDETSPFYHGMEVFSMTPGYSPPEYIGEEKKGKSLDPSFDMWALGVIVYIMLTGAHPFDVYGDASDDEINSNIQSGKRPPLRGSRLVAHLSWHAVDLLERLFEWDPERRMTAAELLENPWVQGKTARQQKMANSDKRLKAFKKFQTKIGAKLFAGMVEGGTGDDEVEHRTSLIERAFRELDPENKGYVTTSDVARATGEKADDGGKHQLSLSGFSDLLAESMKNKYFGKGEVIYREGDTGDHMYFIDSGTVVVETSTGSVVTRGRGDFFGEGALLSPEKLRSATITCKTPVHAMEISREYFEKYMKDSDETLFLELTEKDKIRKRNRSKMILRAQNNLKKRKFRKGQFLFKSGDSGDSIFLVEDGKVDIVVGNQNVFSAGSGNLCGEYSPIMKRPRNASAVCGSKTCEVYEMSGKDFRALLDIYPDIRTSLHDLCLRRTFKKAVVHRINKEFPYSNPREAFDAVKTDKSVKDLTVAEIYKLLLDLNPEYTEEEVKRVVGAIRLTKSDRMSFDEFKKVFIADIKASASI